MTEKEQMKLLRKHAQRVGTKLSEGYKHLMTPQEIAGTLHKIIPEGERKLARISHMTLAESDVSLDNLRAMMHGRPDRVCHPGTYTRLLTWSVDPKRPENSAWVIMMSDTPYEMRAGRELRKEAHGHVLIAGLGLGATLIPVLNKPEVTRVTVLEKNPDVIDLVEHPLRRAFPEITKKLCVVRADAFTWTPGKKPWTVLYKSGPVEFYKPFNTIWLDIWPTICGDNLKEVEKLKRRFAQWFDRSDKNRWMGVWEEDHLRREDRTYRKRKRAIWGTIGGEFPQKVDLK